MKSFLTSTRLLIAGGLLIAAVTVNAGAQPPNGEKAKQKQSPQVLFRLADENKDGKVSLEEFTKFIARAPFAKAKAKGADFAKRLFDRLDTNKDGFLSKEEFAKLAELRQGLGKGKNKSDSPASNSSAKFNDKPTDEQLAFFEKKIRPVLAGQCYSCHAETAKKIKGGLKLDGRDSLRAGGENGPAIVPGDADHSLLIKAIRHTDENLQMPPKNKLSDEIVNDFAIWVKMGAPDPRGAAKAALSEINIEKGRSFWAFQPVKRSTVPAVKDEKWVRSAIDQYLLAGLEAKGLKPVADADERTLLRRLYLDLTGLPPSPEEAEAYVFDQSPDKWEKTVDKLLASPRFGERWGRHWLDVARYAESTGKSVNFNYPHAWRYRDYVIAAYNADKPFDQFVREQMAGDLLPAANDKEKAEHIIATGFLAVGTKSLNERNPRQFELDVADEQIDTFSQAFLGITAACARCHDHKFDPIPQRDYYSLVGIFRSTETCYGTINTLQSRYPSPLVTLPPGADVPAGLEPLPQREHDRIADQVKRLRDELTEMAKSKGQRETFLSMNGVRNRIQIAILEARLDLYEKDGTPRKVAMGVREKNFPKDSPIFQRGEPDKPGDVVPRGTLQVVGTNRLTIRSGSGRKELANWIASKDNPLTARVYVNRVWLHLFGKGLVATPDNFGASGQTPSSPQLLDDLAIWFTDNGWSTKKLIKHIVMSHAYRLSTRSDEHNYEADPDNTLVWRMSPGRLDAETIRDSMLAIAGTMKYDRPEGSIITRGGEGYNAAMNRPGGGLLAVRSLGIEPPNRSVYLPIVRDNLPESLALFDAADPSFVSGERMNTTVPSQALFLMNNNFVIKQADAAAERVRNSGTTDSERIRQAYLLFFGRPPRDAELTTVTEFLESYGKHARPRATWTAFCQAMFGSAEFLFRN